MPTLPHKPAHTLPLFLFRQYDESHELFRDDLPLSLGPHHFRAQEVAGDRTPGWEVHERIQARFERIQSANRAGDFSPGSRKPPDNSTAQLAPGGGHQSLLE